MYKINFDQLRQGNLRELFALIEEELRHLDIDFYLIGAIARDVWMTALHKIEPGRITKDLDLAVLMSDEKQYRQLKQKLVATGRFIASRDNTYTLFFDDKRPVDLLPFGELAMEGAVQVAGKGLTTIQVDGFQEVYEAGTEAVDISGYTFRVCTLAGIVMLKLIAYDDRPDERPKDMQDIGHILRHYFDIAVNEIHDNHLDLFDEGFSMEKAAARLIGRQMQPIINRSSTLRNRIEQILHDHIEIGEQSRAIYWLVKDSKWTIEAGVELMRQLRTGLHD